MNGETNGSEDPKREVIIDMDGFFRHAAESEGSTVSDVLNAMPSSTISVREVLVLHSLIRSSLVFPGPVTGPQEREVLDSWSESALLQAIVDVDRGNVTKKPKWLTFYAEDLREEFSKAFENALDATVQLTLDNRLFAWTNPKSKEIRLSAITREYLLRLNVFLINSGAWELYKEGLIDADLSETLLSDLSDSFLSYAMNYIARLHRRSNPTAIPVVRPNSIEDFRLAQVVTQIQIEFLLAHEFGHLVLSFPEGTPVSEQEFACDSFAFERVAKTESSVWKWFMAIRWLFDILALDRVVGEILIFEEGDWSHDIDWMQSELRERQRRVEIVVKHHGSDNPALSREEGAGTLLLLDAKWRLRRLGRDGAQSLINTILEAAPDISVEDFRNRAHNAINRYINRRNKNAI
ncbi:hypothetical protein [Arthrobacter sp. R4-81]